MRYYAREPEMPVPGFPRGAQVFFRRAVLAAGIAIATILPTTGTATADEGAASGWIIGTDYSSGSPTLVSLDPVTGDIIATFAGNADEGALSPKDSAMAYIQRDSTCIPQLEGCTYAKNLVVAEADGSNQHILVPGIEPETNEAPSVFYPDWSPNGERIVYNSPRGLEWINSDGTGQEVLASGAAGTFSPNGKSIAFVKYTAYETPDGWEYARDVWTMDTDTRQMRQITTTHNAMSSPVDWSPDGQNIVYVTDNGLSVVNVATGTITELHSGAPLSNIRGPVFSPDGTRIAFSAMDNSDYTDDIYVVDAADGGILQLLGNQTVVPSDWLKK